MAIRDDPTIAIYIYKIITLQILEMAIIQLIIEVEQLSEEDFIHFIVFRWSGVWKVLIIRSLFMMMDDVYHGS